jgi:PAS domain S-box-containing protein
MTTAKDRGGRILVVADDPGVARRERACLERAGYTVDMAGTTQEAMQRLRQHRTDLILLHTERPADAQPAFYAQIKAAGYDLPVLLITRDEAPLLRSLRFGDAEGVSRPANPLDQVPQAVDRVLKQVRMENQLAESQAQLMSVFGSAKDAIIVTGSKRRVTLFNKAAEQMFRCPASQAIGQPLTRFIPKEYDSGSSETLITADRQLESLTHHVLSGKKGIRANGEEFPLETAVTRSTVSGQTFHTIVVRDISDRIRAERALLESEERFRLVAMATQDIVRDWDLVANRLWWNEAVGTLLGYPAHETKSDVRWWHDHIHPEDRDRVIRGVCAVVEGDGQFWSDEYRYCRADGSYAHFIDRSYVIRGPSGKPARMIGSMVDITRRKQAEATLEQERAMLAQRVEGPPPTSAPPTPNSPGPPGSRTNSWPA